MGRPAKGSLERRPDRPGGVWYCRISVQRPDGGRDRPWYCLNTTNEVEAIRLRDALVAKTTGPVEQRPRRFDEYARAWVEARAAAGVAFAESERGWIDRYMVPELGEKLLGDIRPADARAVIARARGAGLALQTIRHIRATLRRCLEQARLDEIIPANPVDLAPAPKARELKQQRKEREILKDEELLQLIVCAEVPLEIRLLALCSRAEGGMRTRDLTAWRWSDIDLPGLRWCTIPRTKTGKPQRLEVPDVLAPALRAWWVEAGSPTSGPVFPVTRGPRKGEARRARGVSFAKRLRRSLLVAGVARLPLVEGKRGKRQPDPRDPLYFETEVSLPVDFHSFRRAFGTALAEAGVNEQTAKRLGGWSTSQAYGRYLSTSSEARKIPLAALPAAPKQAEEKRPSAPPPGAEKVLKLGAEVRQLSEGWDAMEAFVQGEEGGKR